MNLNEYMKNNKDDKCTWLTKRVEMNDGFNVSIQASEFHYCEPRKNTEPEKYRSFELGYPSDRDELIDLLGEEKETNDTVFPYVDRDVVEQLILKHGGIKGVFKGGDDVFCN